MSGASEGVDRRTWLRLSAVAAGLVVSGFPGGAGAAPATITAPTPAAIVAWLTFGTDGPSRVRLFGFDASGHPSRELDDVTLPPGSLTDAAGRTAALVTARAAALWSVPARECACRRAGVAAHIEHGTGRALPFAVWTDFA